MPIRKVNFVNGGIYHVFNRTIESNKIFLDDLLCSYFLESSQYYRSSKTRIRFSDFKHISNIARGLIEKQILNPNYFKIEILCYCIMPTHFHFLLKQQKDMGITKFISDVLNSFTRYFNIKNKRIGPIFLPRFKALQITNENQLKHVSRYIHLNPYSANLVIKLNNLVDYRWSSFKEYMSRDVKKLTSSDFMLSFFGHDEKRYKKFVFDNASYQKSLEYIKHMDRW